MMQLHMTENPDVVCRHLEAPHPLAPPNVVPPIFTPVRSNHTCLTRFYTFGSYVGDIPDNYCATMINVTKWSNATKFKYARSDVYWYCGKNRLRNTLPPNWSGTCTIISLIAQIKIIKVSASEVALWQYTAYQDTPRLIRHRRNTFDIYKNSPTYIDAIGVPRGVPDEYKLVNQIAAGFESSLFWWATINKNVDRINYIHFNVQRMNNMTRDAIPGLHEQLAAMSLMTYKNRMALDFLLAERGGVCSMFYQDCCVFIPNNTAQDGSVTRTLSGLRTMSEELTEHSGQKNLLADWLDKTFGTWKTMITYAFISLVVAVTTLTLCGCCCIPCIRHLCLKCITTAIDNKFPAPPAYQLVQHYGDTIPLENFSGLRDEDHCLYT